jgi:CHASE3 domain sensor protein
MFGFLLSLTLMLCISIGTALTLQRMTHNTDLTKDWFRGCITFSLLCWVFSLGGFAVGLGICSIAVVCFYLNEYRIWRNL